MSGRHEAKKATMAANLEADTGRSVSEWVALLEQAGIEGFATSVSWLKERHGLGHFKARLVAEAQRDS